MKVAMISGAMIAALAAGAVATPSFAQPYHPYGYDSREVCHGSGNTTAGAVIGGIAGALLGSNLASHHGGRAGGAALGGVAGALIGSSIARSSDKDRCDTQAYGYDNRSYGRGYSSSYEAPRYSGGYGRGYSGSYYAPRYNGGYGQSYSNSYYAPGYEGGYSRPSHDRDDWDD
jgi:hypothetical protein